MHFPHIFETQKYEQNKAKEKKEQSVVLKDTKLVSETRPIKIKCWVRMIQCNFEDSVLGFSENAATPSA